MHTNARVIDLNADVGERPGAAGLADDEAIMSGVSSVSVACGFHAGDGETMRRVCEAAVRLHKAIGAHVSYLDRAGFGRRELVVAPAVLRDHVAQQIAALQATAVLAGGSVRYVKPHGALYSQAAVDPRRAQAVASGLASVDQQLSLLAPPDSELLRAAAAAGITAFAEGFADRAYRADGSLVPRTQDGAVLGTQAALAQALELARCARFRSLCLHSDTPGAAKLAVAVRDRLIGAGFEVRPFSR